MQLARCKSKSQFPRTLYAPARAYCALRLRKKCRAGATQVAQNNQVYDNAHDMNNRRYPDNTMIKVFGSQWNALLKLILAALDEDPSPLASTLRNYLEAKWAQNDLEDIEVSVDIVRLIKDIAPATTLTPMELDHVKAECDGLLNDL